MADPTTIALAAATITTGLGGLTLAWRKFPREDAREIVGTQAQVLDSMKLLNDELEDALTRCRAERVELAKQLVDKTRELHLLEAQGRARRRRETGGAP